MAIRDKELLTQWAQLGALSGVHFLADVFPGTIHSVLPAIQAEFLLSISLGGVLLVSFNIASNWMQVATGHLRADRTNPLFMYLGLILAAMLCLLTILPRSQGSLPVMIVVVLIAGSGVAIVHPEALRAIHLLDRISPTVSTAFFMSGGILGFAMGGKYATELVNHFGGVVGLLPLALCPLLCIPAVAFLKIRLAVEEHGEDARKQAGRRAVPFVPVLLMATAAAVSSSTIVWIVPQKLKEAGFDLTFGGDSVMMFSLGGGMGAFFWAAAARRFGDILSTCLAVSLGIPLIVCYAFFIEHEPAVWLLTGGSFCAFGAYPLTVSIARGASGPRLGRRMGWMVGGSWGVACLFPIVLAPVAERYGVDTILMLSPVGYVIAVVAAIWIMTGIKAVDTRRLPA
jgi:FSR family fosmidomycin resistance protein-like MFS transporter